MRCEDCGKEAKPGDAFCRQCGSSLGGEKAPADESVVEGVTAGKDEESAAVPEEGAAAVPEEGKEAVPAEGEEAESGIGEAAAPVPEETAAAALVPPAAPVVPPPQYPPPRPRDVVPTRTNGWAIASLVLGILSFMCIPFIGAVLAIVFGIIAKNGIKRSKGELGGSGLATAGLVLGIVNLSFLLIFAVAAVPWFIINIGRTETVTRTVAAQGAQSVTADLEIDSGSLHVGGGAGDMFEGTFTYNIKKWEPEIDYGVRGDVGELSVQQGGGWWIPTFWFIRNDWEIDFSNNMPLDLSANLSSGDGVFDLKTLSLHTLDVNASSGDVSVDLSGDMPDLRRVSLDGSSGGLDLELGGKYQTYIQMDVQNSSGDVNLNLAGEWESALGANIMASSGDVSIRLPQDVGVRVRVRTRSGDVNAPGMKLDSKDDDGAVYVNDEFRRSLITLQIDVEVSSGDITLLLAE